MKIDRRKINGAIMALLAVVFWAGNIVIASGIGGMYSPIVTSFMRWLLALIIFTPFVIKKTIAEWELIKKQKWIILFNGVFCVGLFSLFVYMAGETAGATNISLIMTTSPIFTLIFLKVIFKEKIGMKRITGMIIVILGILLLFSRGDIRVLMNLDFVAGDIITLIAAIAWGSYMVVNKLKDSRMSSSVFVYSGFLVAFITMLPFMTVYVAKEGFPVIYWSGLLCFLYIAVFNCIFAFVLWSLATERLGTANVAPIYNIIPAITCVLAIIFIEEKIIAMQIVAMVIVFVGVIITQDSFKKRK